MRVRYRQVPVWTTASGEEIKLSEVKTEHLQKIIAQQLRNFLRESLDDFFGELVDEARKRSDLDLNDILYHIILGRNRTPKEEFLESSEEDLFS